MLCSLGTGWELPERSTYLSDEQHHWLIHWTAYIETKSPPRSRAVLHPSFALRCPDIPLLKVLLLPRENDKGERCRELTFCFHIIFSFSPLIHSMQIFRLLSKCGCFYSLCWLITVPGVPRMQRPINQQVLIECLLFGRGCCLIVYKEHSVWRRHQIHCAASGFKIHPAYLSFLPTLEGGLPNVLGTASRKGDCHLFFILLRLYSIPEAPSTHQMD